MNLVAKFLTFISNFEYALNNGRLFSACLKIWIGVSCPLVFSQTQSIHPFTPQKFLGEQLNYKLEYLNLSAASLNFQIPDTARIDHITVNHLIVKATSSRSAGMLFKLDNRYETYFDRTTFLPQKIYKSIRQKNIMHDLTIMFDHRQHQASRGDSIFWSIPADCYDYFSMLYYLRAQPLLPGDTLRFHLDSEYRVSKVEAVVLSEKKQIDVPAGKFDAIQLQVKFAALKNLSRPWKTDLLTNRLAAPGSELTIYFSDDHVRLPLKISYHQSVINTQIILKSFQRGH